MSLGQPQMGRRSKKSSRVYVWVCRRLPPEVWQAFSPLHSCRGAGCKEHLVWRKWIKLIVPAQIQVPLKNACKTRLSFCFVLFVELGRALVLCARLQFAALAALMLFSSQKHGVSPSVLTVAWQERGRRHILARAPTACGWTRCDAQATSWRWSSVQKVLGGNTTASTLRTQECRAAHSQVVLQGLYYS